jgi:hypothetical protein
MDTRPDAFFHTSKNKENTKWSECESFSNHSVYTELSICQKARPQFRSLFVFEVVEPAWRRRRIVFAPLYRPVFSHFSATRYEVAVAGTGRIESFH